MVAQGHGFLDPLEADRVLLETGDRQGAGDGAGGHDDVVVVELEGLVVLGFDDDELVGVVDRRHLAGDDLGAGQVAAQRHDGVTGFDRTGSHLGEEGLVRHVRVGVDDGHGGFTAAEILQQILGRDETEVSAADDEDAWTQFRVSDESHSPILGPCENFH